MKLTVLGGRLFPVSTDMMVFDRDAFESNVGKVVPLRIEGQDTGMFAKLHRVWIEDDYVMADFEITNELPEEGTGG